MQTLMILLPSTWMVSMALWLNTCSKAPRSFTLRLVCSRALMNILSSLMIYQSLCCLLCSTQRHLVPRLVKKGDDGNYGSTSVCDAICLQSLSKRIHYGKFVSQAKFQASP